MRRLPWSLDVVTHRTITAEAYRIRQELKLLHHRHTCFATVLCPIIPYNHSSGYRRCPHVWKHTNILVPSALRATSQSFVPGAKQHAFGNETPANPSGGRWWTLNARMSVERTVWEEEGMPADERDLPRFRTGRNYERW